MGWMISDNVTTSLALYVVLALLAVWAALVLWTWNDMAGRSRNTSYRFLAAVVVALLIVPGLLIYLMLRPRETLAEAYERSLEEEVLLRGIEEKSACPSCKAQTQPEWQLCRRAMRVCVDPASVVAVRCILNGSAARSALPVRPAPKATNGRSLPTLPVRGFRTAS